MNVRLERKKERISSLNLSMKATDQKGMSKREEGKKRKTEEEEVTKI